MRESEMDFVSMDNGRLIIQGMFSTLSTGRYFFNRFSPSKLIKTLGHDGLLCMKDNQVTEPEKTLQRRKYNTKNRVQDESRGRLTLHLKGDDCRLLESKTLEEM